MSRLLPLLAAATTGGATPNAPQPQPLTTSDPVLLQMRPHGKRRIIATIEVGPGKPYATITAGINAAKAAQAAKRAQESAAFVTPEYWVAVLVQPGTYYDRLTGAEAVSVHAMGAVEVVESTVSAGATGNPIDWGQDTLAGSGFWEGITFRQPASNPAVNLRGKYLLHNIVGGNYASVFAGCTFVEQNPNANAVYGQNEATGCNLTFYNCTWTNTAGVSNQVMYGIGTVNVINMQGNTGNFGGGGGRVGDHLWVDELTYFPGGLAIGAASALHAPANAASSFSYTGSLRDYRTDWPIPIGGLTPDNHTYWYG